MRAGTRVKQQFEKLKSSGVKHCRGYTIGMRPLEMKNSGGDVIYLEQCAEIATKKILKLKAFTSGKCFRKEEEKHADDGEKAKTRPNTNGRDKTKK